MKRLIAVLSIFCLLLSGCTLPGGKQDLNKNQDLSNFVTGGAKIGKAPDATFRTGQMGFSLELFQQVAGESKGKNMLVSPLSVAPALAMTANGAAGKTQDEMLIVLGGYTAEELNRYLKGYLSNISEQELKLANSIWIREGKQIREEFLQTNADYFDAQIYQAPFDDSTVQAINGWVKGKTDGMIEKLLEQISSKTMVYLINALAFDAEWQEPYIDTRPGTFSAYDGTEQAAKMLVSEEGQYLADENAVGIIRDYAGGDYRFAALMPNEGMDIYDYVQGLTVEGLLNTLKHPKRAGVEAKLPKFSYEYEIKLNDTLKAMGMPTAFEGGAADFSGMSEGLYISEVRHKTFIELTEAGTRAGAVTSVAMEDSAPVFERFITLDRPFVYFILDAENDLPVFMGIVTSM